MLLNYLLENRRSEFLIKKEGRKKEGGKTGRKKAGKREGVGKRKKGEGRRRGKESGKRFVLFSCSH